MLARVRASFAVLLFAATAFAAGAVAQNQDIQDLSTFPRTTLEIRTKPQPQKFSVWIADTPSRQAQGLMFVRDLPADEGMIFPMAKPRVATFWMKNTFIELDMIFVAGGRIAQIAPHAKPQTLSTISSAGPVEAVLELKGGEAARRGLKVGDSVTWIGADSMRGAHTQPASRIRVRFVVDALDINVRALEIERERASRSQDVHSHDQRGCGLHIPHFEDVEVTEHDREPIQLNLAEIDLGDQMHFAGFRCSGRAVHIRYEQERSATSVRMQRLAQR
jgi:uncharacterized membrane protein (UPF0127 family)